MIGRAFKCGVMESCFWLSVTRIDAGTFGDAMGSSGSYVKGYNNRAYLYLLQVLSVMLCPRPGTWKITSPSVNGTYMVLQH